MTRLVSRQVDRFNHVAVAARCWLRDYVTSPTRESERGEGVISAAIAVLIMAFLGVAMWLAFKSILSSATTNLAHQVSQIGQ